MSPAKLSDADKQTMVDLYRQTPATTTTLAERFGVSNSTICRLLKAALSTSEYESLIQSKRAGRGGKAEAQLSLSLNNADRADSSPVVSTTTAEPGITASSSPGKRRRTRSTKAVPASPIADEPSNNETESALSAPAPLPTEQPTKAVAPSPETTSPPKLNRPQIVAIKSAALDEIVKDLDDDFSNDDELDDLDDLDDDLDDEEDNDDLEDDGEDEPIMMIGKNGNVVSVRPFTEAVLPKSCYLVIDRMSELIVRPLKELTPKGAIPETEVRQKTLPIFDNHRVARRFSLRTQRVIKVPDSKLFHKTTPSLKAKGITRIFLDGQVYTL